MASLQQQARALGDPTRYEVFRYVVDAARPVDVAELTAHLALNHNAIRQHLSKLVDAGLLSEEKSPSGGRGRPRLQYVPDPAAEGRWDVVGPYERLSLWLSEIVRTGDPPVEVGRRVAARDVAACAVPDHVDPVQALVDLMARHGFNPAVSRNGSLIDITLRACPFASTAAADPGTVCDLHLGMAQGIAVSVGGLAIDGLTPNDPLRAHCRLRCHVDDDS